MGLNDTPKGERLHIAIFGRRNVGKSSLINAITGQELSIVSDVLGTTTDPVYKAMELLPLGPVMMVDTPGLDDEGELGILRVKKAKMVLNKADIAIVVLDASKTYEDMDWQIEKELLSIIEEKKLPYLIVVNKMDLCQDIGQVSAFFEKELSKEIDSKKVLYVSTEKKEGIEALKNKISELVPQEEDKPLVRDLLNPSDFVVLVVPIDKAAPKGRLILPQQQTIRDILNANAISIVTKETELKETLKNLGKKPKMVITDSQVFKRVAMDTPEDIPLTSFSVLFARYKGELGQFVDGIRAIQSLKDGDRILMAEGCTHKRQCGDIGTEKIPRWLMEFAGKELIFETSSGNEFPEDLSPYKLIVHCGGCMLNRREMQYRLKQAKDWEKSIVNYGILIAYMNGILERSLELFKEKE